MALVSGGRSMLNPNAPPFVPAARQPVQDFPPEWWNLVTPSAGFRNYWLNQQLEDEEINGFDENDAVGLLPEDIDVGVDEEILSMEAEFEEFLRSSEAYHEGKEVKGIPENGSGKNAEAVIKHMRQKSPREPAKHWDKPARHVVSPKCGPLFIQQPR